MKKLLDMLEYNDLNDGLKLIADVLGLDAVKELLRKHSGEVIYIPYTNHIRPVVRRFIAKIVRSDSKIDIKRVSKEVNLSKNYVKVLIKQFYQNNSKSSSHLRAKQNKT
jgi:hypothetical protein